MDAGISAMLMAGQMHPPFSFRSCRKENGPCTVQKKRPLGRAPVQWPSALTGVGVPVPAPILPSLRARLGLLRFPQLPTRGGWCGGRRGARSHLTSFSFRAFRFATRCPGGRRGRPFWEGNNGTFPHQPFLRPYGDKVFNSSSPVTPSCASSLANGIRSSASPSTL
mgnify:CR=1 FL=1